MAGAELLHAGSDTQELALNDDRRELAPAPYRPHTAEHWRTEDPETYALCVQAIRDGITSVTKLADMFKRSRQTVHALKWKEFTAEEIAAIIAKGSIIAAAEGVERTVELMPLAENPTQAAMAAKMMMEVHALASNKPTSITEHRVVIAVEDFNEALEQAATVDVQATVIDAV
jgi:hypothetical protein